MKRILAGLCVLTSLHVHAQNNKLLSTGNVGIGTNTPNSQFLLHVANGDVLLQNTSGTGYPKFWSKSADGNTSLMLDYNSILINGSNGYLRTSGDLFLNDVGGNVSIGTTNPHGYKLAVNGSAIFTSATVKLYPNWPDYVFEKDYQLLPLPELEKFIQQNKHLPEVPTADEVAKDGLNLGTTQAALLKKIEELTLYIIEQNKKMEKQDKVIEDLQERLTKLEK